MGRADAKRSHKDQEKERLVRAQHNRLVLYVWIMLMLTSANQTPGNFWMFLSRLSQFSNMSAFIWTTFLQLQCTNGATCTETLSHTLFAPSKCFNLLFKISIIRYDHFLMVYCNKLY